MSTAVDFTWWERQEPATFLAHDWTNPSRVIGTGLALRAALARDGSLLEIGPGAGTDYAHSFRAAVLAGRLHYTGYEPTQRFCAALERKYPESAWVNAPIDAIPPGVASVVYTRAVLEHQPELDAALSGVCAAARDTVVIDWYRPPAAHAQHEVRDGVHYHTFAATDVLSVIVRAGFAVVTTETAPASANAVWLLERQ